MRPRRPHVRARLRGSLVAMLVAIVAGVSLVGSYVRAPDAMLAVAFARARAVEAAVTDEGRPCLRVEREEGHLDDVPGIRPSADVAKSAPVEREAHEEGVSLRFAVSRLRASHRWSLDIDEDTGIASLPSDPPTRGRARLMVFLD